MPSRIRSPVMVTLRSWKLNSGAAMPLLQDRSGIRGQRQIAADEADAGTSAPDDPAEPRIPQTDAPRSAGEIVDHQQSLRMIGAGIGADRAAIGRIRCDITVTQGRQVAAPMDQAAVET